MTNPIKSLPKIIKTARLEMRQLDATPENAQLIFDAVKDENPADFYFNRICNTNLVPVSADEMLKQMQIESQWVADNGVNLYIFHNGNLIGYRRLFFHDDATKTLLEGAKNAGFIKDVPTMTMALPANDVNNTTTFTDVTFTFEWGSTFGGMNPYKFYNENNEFSKWFIKV